MYEISEDMLHDIARDRNDGATWAFLSRLYGIPPQALKRAYLRKSREVYAEPCFCGVARGDHFTSEVHRFNHVWTPAS